MPSSSPASAEVQGDAPAERLGAGFFARPVAEVAPDLVGCTLLHAGVGGTIVEVERYQEDDPASHSFRGPRGRALVMFGPPGGIYVYRSYGIHWCVNLVCEEEGRGAAVLIRALAPTAGLDEMRRRRGPGIRDRLLCAGPGRLAQALGVDASLNGGTVLEGPVEVLPRTGPVAIAAGPRIGIAKAADQPWRFGVAGSPYLSRPFPKEPS